MLGIRSSYSGSRLPIDPAGLAYLSEELESVGDPQVELNLENGISKLYNVGRYKGSRYAGVRESG